MGWERHHTVWTVLGLGAVANTMFRRGIGPILLPLREGFELSYSEAALVAFVPAVSYALVQVPSGYLGDRLGRGRILLAGSLLWGSALALAGVSPTFATLLVLLAAAGVGEGTLFGNDRPLIALHTPAGRQAIGQSVSFAAGGFGTWAGVLGAGLVAESFGWRPAFVLFAGPVFLFAFALHRWVCSLPEAPGRPSAGGRSDHGAPGWRALATPGLLAMYACGLAVTFTTWFLGTWGPALFLDAGVTGLRGASARASLFGLAMMVGLPVTGLLGDRLASPGARARLLAGLLVLSGFLVVGLGLGIRHDLAPGGLLALAMAVIVLSSGCWPLLTVFLSAEAPAHRLGLTFGVANGFWQAGALSAPVLGGWFRDTTDSFAGGCDVSAALLVVTAIGVLAASPRMKEAVR